MKNVVREITVPTRKISSPHLSSDVLASVLSLQRLVHQEGHFHSPSRTLYTSPQFQLTYDHFSLK